MSRSDQTWEIFTSCQYHWSKDKLYCKRHRYFILVILKRKMIVDNSDATSARQSLLYSYRAPRRWPWLTHHPNFCPTLGDFWILPLWDDLLRALRIDLESHDISKICLQLLRFKSWCTNLWSNSLGLIDNTWRLWDSCNNRQCQFYAKF